MIVFSNIVQFALSDAIWKLDYVCAIEAAYAYECLQIMELFLTYRKMMKKCAPQIRAINGRTQIGIIEANSNQFNTVCTYEWKKCLQIIDLLLTWRKTI